MGLLSFDELIQILFQFILEITGSHKLVTIHLKNDVFAVLLVHHIWRINRANGKILDAIVQVNKVVEVNLNAFPNILADFLNAIEVIEIK